MRITNSLSISLLLFSASFFSQAGTAVYKCIANGTVTYQQDTCPSTAPRRDPNIERLNLEEKKKQAEKRRESANLNASMSPARSGAPDTASPTKASAADTAPPPPLPAASFKCDGRTHCSQMTSCSEAKFFLAQCPRVKMDGDKNGIPCEQQWCNR